MWCKTVDSLFFICYNRDNKTKRAEKPRKEATKMTLSFEGHEVDNPCVRDFVSEIQKHYSMELTVYNIDQKTPVVSVKNCKDVRFWNRGSWAYGYAITTTGFHNDKCSNKYAENERQCGDKQSGDRKE
jgi:hypothetical protein